MITWLMVALHLWLFLYHKGQLIFFQSKKEIDSNELVNRAKFIYEHLPNEIRQIHSVKMSYLKIKAGKGTPNEYSRIIGIPQGKDVLRQYTASAIFSDETAFQDMAEESYMAAKPTIDGGGRYTAVSSANGGNFFYRLLKGELDSKK